MNGRRLINALLLPHALDLLALQLPRGIVGKEGLRLRAGALQLLRQAAFLPDKLLDYLVGQAVPGRGLGDEHVLHLLRTHHLPCVRGVLVHGALHRFELETVHGLADGVPWNGRLKAQRPILQFMKSQLLLERRSR